jgi:hypothetical protein
MSNRVTQNLDMYGIAEKLGTLCERTETLMIQQDKIKDSVDDIKSNGLPTCVAHNRRMEFLEKEFAKAKPWSSTDTFGYGKWKAGGAAAVFVAIIISVGAVAIGVIKILK